MSEDKIAEVTWVEAAYGQRQVKGAPAGIVSFLSHEDRVEAVRTLALAVLEAVSCLSEHLDNRELCAQCDAVAETRTRIEALA